MLFCLQLRAQEYKYKVKQFSVGDGLAHSDATSFAQDANGFIWIGSFAGLNKFDGYNFELFRNNINKLSGPFTNRIMDLSHDNNILFIATQGGLVAFNTDTEIFLPISYSNLSNNEIKQATINKLHAQNGKLFLTSANNLHVFTYNFQENQLVLEEKKLVGEQIPVGVHSIVYDKGNLWITSSNGLYHLTANTGNTSYYLKKITTIDQNNKNLSIDSGLFLDNKNNLWGASENSLYLLDIYSLDDGKMKVYMFDNFGNKMKEGMGLSKLTDFQVNSIRMTADENLWIGTDHGLVQLKVNINDLSYTFYSSENYSNRNQISSKRINGLFEDKDHNLWITTYGGGINFINLKQSQFYNLSMQDPANKGALPSNFIRALVEDKSGNLWIGTERSGLFYFNFSDNSYTSYVNNENDSNSIMSNGIRSLKLDSKNNLWIGTLEGISVLDVAKGKMKHLYPNKADENSLTGGSIFDIKEDKFGSIWAGSWTNGLNKITKVNNDYSIQQFRELNKKGPLGLRESAVSYILTDSVRPEVFVATTKGINHIHLDNNGDVKKIKHYYGIEGFNKSLTSNFIWPMVRENDSILWVGTIGGGLNKLILDQTSPYGYKAEQLKSLGKLHFSDIESLEIDVNGVLWIGSNGLSSLNLATYDFSSFNYEDGLQGNNLKIGVSDYGKSGRMYFGGTEGITYFYPKEIKKDTTTRKPVLTGLTVNGKKIGIGTQLNEHVILDSDINKQKHINLIYGENDFTINFSSLNFSNPKSNNYRYILQGHEQNWTKTTGELPFATYSNLDYGDYIFKVSVSNGNDSWSNYKQLKITLSPPWWWSSFSKFLYSIIFLSVVYLGYRWVILKRAYEISVIEKNQKEEINKLRLQFFTNISHEFKTPLTLIINPLQELLKGNLGKRKKLRYYNHMLGNTKRMLRLVNELMDFQKIETKAYNLNPEKESLEDVLKEIYQSFSEFALSKDIKFTYTIKEKIDLFWFDKTVLEKILYNILGNAFKYTKLGDTIKIEIFKNYEQFGPKSDDSYEIWNQQTELEYVWIKISDSGIGISDRELKFIFDRFFHKPNNDNSQPEGSGVGLSLVKSLVNLQKGSIVVTSKENLGTTFYISIPYTKIFVKEEITNNNINLSKSSLSPVYDSPNMKATIGEDYGKSSILVVEDNHELRFFMKENFSDEFHVLEAENGEDAINILGKHKPDLIISDVNMPKMDGIELCRHVKENEKFSSIPFILLTSNQTVTKQLEGLQAKADLYLSKPFSIEVLKISIQNIIQNRKDLTHRIVENTFEEAHSISNNLKDSEFIKKITNIINENIELNEFDVSMLSNLLGMSRTKVYNKVKEVTGKAAGEIIREIRVKKAASLLASEDISVSQAMYRVGIQSQSYFTKIFKKEFGKTPTKFVQELDKK